jgi:hypothetical protein
MFSPAEVQSTPAAVSRSPSGGSPGHWWDSPQPSAIRRLCADELACRPAVIVSAGSPAAERAWLISASTCVAAAPPWAAGALAGAEAAADLEAAGRGDGGRKDADGIVATVGAATTIPAATAAQPPAAAAPHPAAVARGLDAARLDAGPGKNSPRARYRPPPVSTASASAPESLPPGFPARGTPGYRGHGRVRLVQRPGGAGRLVMAVSGHGQPVDGRAGKRQSDRQQQPGPDPFWK